MGIRIISDPNYRWLSNFSPHPIEMNGLLWQTVEHYYQSQKFNSPLEPNHKIMDKIFFAKSPAEAKKLGKTKGLREDWELVKVSIMIDAVHKKFEMHADIREMLIKTDNLEILEDAPWDNYWGTGKDGKGLNKLGKILMDIRYIFLTSASICG